MNRNFALEFVRVTEAAALFRGQGSFGNGSAMRVAPLGAYFADDPERITEQASLSSIPTHSHPEAVAGAVAVAVATGLAWRMKNSAEPPNSQEFLQYVHQHLPDSYVRKGIRNAIELPLRHRLKPLLRGLETALL